MTQTWAQVQYTFQQIWGYDDFRPPQDQIIRSLLAGQDALIIMPTGGGKSICFQLPAILQTGLTLVVSPLVALMENQVQTLQEKRLPARLLHSQLSKLERRHTLQAVAKNQLRLLYLSPETLLSPPVWEILIQPQLKVNGLILDEAHCLVQWGDTFRPAYRRLGAVRPALLRHKPKGSKMAIAAFTATADPQAQKSISQTLQLKSPKKFVQSPYRPNLQLVSRTVWSPKGKRDQLHRFIQTNAKASGLIYVRSRREAETLAMTLGQQNYQTAAYHAGLSPGDRRQQEKDWQTGRLQFVVCTNAFGMGIDKADVRWILHYHPPSLLAEYLQEIGRAGRDGKKSTALSLISEPTGFLNPEDKNRARFFQQNLQKQIRDAAKLAQTLPLQGSILELDHQAELSLGILHSTGQLRWRDPFTYERQPTLDPTAFSLLQQQQIHAVRQLQTFWRQKNCRWQFLIDSFGFHDQAQDFRCGHCDRCQNSS
ncbi:recombinase RecQ [Picosynechococcus sp. PCC 7003]|uniref:RecQ family ATP-dependent DNA helicase n=1 Tax=Picosynechococcus sp. PCC 7003 TaxID=374981 RepID=UPI000810DB23|nr:RecQ family ATP-dependent DNA helicase [Picosynechococcus sp. PCC 7003]ANV83724.1 recombinase RecQ [Picosynechococcus sp. PCC 7003]